MLEADDFVCFGIPGLAEREVVLPLTEAALEAATSFAAAAVRVALLETTRELSIVWLRSTLAEEVKREEEDKVAVVEVEPLALRSLRWRRDSLNSASVFLSLEPSAKEAELVSTLGGAFSLSSSSCSW